MFRSIAMLTLYFSAITAHGALLGRAALTPGGSDYQAYYDDVLNITWLADANYAVTNDFGFGGSYMSSGGMPWDLTNMWMDRLNSASHLGKSGWRLPKIVDSGGALGCADSAYSGTDCGYNVPTMGGSTVYSELAHLYHVTLGNIAAYDQSGILQSCSSTSPTLCLSNSGPFSNVRRTYYWFGQTDLTNVSQAWNFDFGQGHQATNFRSNSYYVAWAVHDGDPFAVAPIPPAVWLFGSALGVMGWMRRKLAN